MASRLLDGNCTIQCPHGGRARITPSQSRVLLGAASVLLGADSMVVQGCANAPPCVSIRWSLPAAHVRTETVRVLTETSAGECLDAGGIARGAAIVTGEQTRVRGE
jgi:hypothetical protein